MRESVYIGLLLAVLTLNASLSFYYNANAKKEREAIKELFVFKEKGARYTKDDGDREREERQFEDDWLQIQIDSLYNLH